MLPTTIQTDCEDMLPDCKSVVLILIYTACMLAAHLFDGLCALIRTLVSSVMVTYQKYIMAHRVLLK